jgi:hypothetical protein
MIEELRVECGKCGFKATFKNPGIIEVCTHMAEKMSDRRKCRCCKECKL